MFFLTVSDSWVSNQQSCFLGTFAVCPLLSTWPRVAGWQAGQCPTLLGDTAIVASKLDRQDNRRVISVYTAGSTCTDVSSMGVLSRKHGRHFLLVCHVCGVCVCVCVCVCVFACAYVGICFVLAGGRPGFLCWLFELMSQLESEVDLTGGRLRENFS